MALRKNLILRRPRSGRLEGRTRLIQREAQNYPLRKRLAPDARCN